MFLRWLMVLNSLILFRFLVQSNNKCLANSSGVHDSITLFSRRFSACLGRRRVSQTLNTWPGSFLRLASRKIMSSLSESSSPTIHYNTIGPLDTTRGSLISKICSLHTLIVCCSHTNAIIKLKISHETENYRTETMMSDL